MALQRLSEALTLKIAYISGEAVVVLISEFFACNNDLLGINHDKIIACINMGSVDRFRFAE